MTKLHPEIKQRRLKSICKEAIERYGKRQCLEGGLRCLQGSERQRFPEECLLAATITELSVLLGSASVEKKVCSPKRIGPQRMV